MSWAIYDWANSVFATVVIAGFFPVVFKSYWASNLSASENTFWLGVGNAVASLVVVCIAPFMGTLADEYKMRKPLLLGFMLVGVISTAMLSGGHQGDWQMVLVFYMLAVIGFMTANVFYDALIISVCDSSQVDKVSGLGYGLGYLGGGLSLMLCVYLSQQPELLGYSSSIDIVLMCFMLVAAWWLVFSIPLAIWTHDRQHVNNSGLHESVFKQTLAAFRRVFSHRQTRLFLIAYWVYIDGVDTIIRMAVDYGMAIGFESSDLIAALLITQFVGFPAAIVYGYIGHHYGVKLSLMVGIAIYGLVTIYGYSMVSVSDFYMLAAIIGLVQGGVQAMSRSFYSRLIPEGHAAEYFGIYNMLGKSAAIIGPMLMGGVALLTENHRYSILSILVLFIIGSIILSKVEEPDKK